MSWALTYVSVLCMCLCRFEEQLKELQDIAISRGKLSTGIATAGGSTTTAGQQQQQQMLQQRLAGVRAS